MKYSKLADVYVELEQTSKKLEKRDILAKFFKGVSEKELPIVVMLSMGKVFVSKEMGVAARMIEEIIYKTYGATELEFISNFKKTGDLGLSAEYFAGRKKQTTLGSTELTVVKVFDNLRKLADISGVGSQDTKKSVVSELLISASPNEAKYIVRTVMEEMRVGVAAGIIRDAIALAFDKDVKRVERAYDFIGDFGEVAVLAKNNKLSTARIKFGRPIRCMLADRSAGLKEAMGKFDSKALEIKEDGFRTQIHKKGDEIRVFSRRLDDVTKQFPDVVEWAKKCLIKDCIVDSETVAIDAKTGMTLAFQQLSRRIHRKYDIERMVRDIPVQVNVFDILSLGGKSVMNKPLSERWVILKDNIKEMKGDFQLIKHVKTNNVDRAEKFYKKVLSLGHEGLIVKNLDAVYQPGRRVGYWLKVKEILDPLDLVIIGGMWGEGKRSKWIGSVRLGAYSEKDDKFVPTGMLGSGLSDLQLDELTKVLKKLIISEDGRNIHIKPRVVIEVGYEEIQKSSKYASGYALRFPRLLRFRDDKKPSQASSVDEIEKIYGLQRMRKV